MAEITVDDAKRMSCTTLTKLGLFHLVEADRGKPCCHCRGPIKRGHTNCGRCSEKAAPLPAQRSRRKEKEQPPKSLLKAYPVVKNSPLLPTVDGVVRVYGPCYAGARVVERNGYEKPQLEHGTPLVLRLLDDDGDVVDERRIVRMTGWEDVAYDWERHLGVFGFDPWADEQVYSIRRCDVVDRITVTPYIRENLGKYSVDALVELASRNGLIDNQSVLCDCFAMLAGALLALAHDPEAQKDYCEKLQRIVGDLFRTDLAEVTVATELLELATPVTKSTNLQRSLLEGSLETLSSLCDATGARLPIRGMVSALPNGGDSDRAAKIYAAADGTERTKALMVTGAREVCGRSMCRRLQFLLVFIDVRRSHSLSG